jgi:hypothetical protein
MYCIDNLDMVKLYGNFNTDNNQALRIEVYTCQPDVDGCRESKELLD